MTYKSMNRYIPLLIAAVLLGAVTTITAAAEKEQGTSGSGQTGSAAGQVQDNKSPAQARPHTRMPNITYRPPLLDDDTGTDANSIRGKTVILQVLAPDHTGLTTKAQPTLYWTMRDKAAIHFTITEIADGAKPVLKADIVKGPGIQQLELARYDVSLKPETRYRWSVTQTVKDGDQSKDFTASGIIERIKPGEGLSNRIKHVRGIALVDVYAIEGIWYDALQAISSMIEEAPEEHNLQAARESLLAQIGVNTDH